MNKKWALGVLVLVFFILVSLLTFLLPHRPEIWEELSYVLPKSGTFDRQMSDVITGLPYMLFSLPLSATLTIGGSFVVGPPGAIFGALFVSFWQSNSEAEMEQASVWKELVNRGADPSEAYELTRREVWLPMLGIVSILGVLGAFPAFILRFIFEKRFSVSKVLLFALLFAFFSLVVQLLVFYPPEKSTRAIRVHGTGITFAISVASLLRPHKSKKMGSVESSSKPFVPTPNDKDPERDSKEHGRAIIPPWEQ